MSSHAADLTLLLKSPLKQILLHDTKLRLEFSRPTVAFIMNYLSVKLMRFMHTLAHSQ